MKSLTLVLMLLARLTAHAGENKQPATESTNTVASAIIVQTFTIESKALGETRRINVYVPSEYKEHPEARYPVLYMPDGGMKEDFPHVVDAVDAMAGWGTMRPVIVVGIENTQRRRDMTGPTEVETDKKIAPKVGGSSAFREFIRKELMPQIQSRYRTGEEKGIVGESLAGLFVVETFLLEPDLFDAYIACSPSLWWNKQAMVKLAEERVKTLPAHKTLYLTSADEEDIVRDTKKLAETLRPATPERLTLIFQPMPEQFHDTIYRAAAPKALRMIYSVPSKASH
jgi:predicted alpha/beta superfamily hydrolase